MPRFRIFPPIGIARLGEDENFFLGPEKPGGGSGELQPDGTTIPVSSFKDATRKMVRKQGARFHIFESDDGVAWRPANLPATATVTWSVRLLNKKSAVTRPADGHAPIVPTRPQVPAANQSLVIDGGQRQVSGQNAVSTVFRGPYSTTTGTGQPFNIEVELGRLRTDGQGRLIVLGGKGFSSAPPGTPDPESYYGNPKWHDDVSDGPVTAEIRLAPGQNPVQAEGGAWVIVAPPDYAPGIECVVTLYDVLRQLGFSEFNVAGLDAPAVPSFDADIEPIIARVRRLRWVHNDVTWSNAKLSSPQLRSTAAADQPLRRDVRDIVLSTQTKFKGHVRSDGPPFSLRDFQNKILDRWVAGNFDATPVNPPNQLTAEGLTKAALDGAAGQGFCPGIEAGIIVLDRTLYSVPFDFRFDHASVRAGDITGLMAQPWQSDFLECNTEWWPTQRPDLAFLNNTQSSSWNRGATTHVRMVQRSARLGVIVRQGANEVFLEVERDPLLP